MFPLTLANKLATSVVEAMCNMVTPTVSFDGPLTSGPRVIPGPAAAAAPGGAVPAPEGPAVALPPVTAGPPATPHGQLPNHGPGLMALDCLFDGCHGGCLNSYGAPIRAGQSCWASTRIMARKDFATVEPKLYAKAIELGLIVPEVQS